MVIGGYVSEEEIRIAVLLLGVAIVFVVFLVEIITRKANGEKGKPDRYGAKTAVESTVFFGVFMLCQVLLRFFVPEDKNVTFLAWSVSLAMGGLALKGFQKWKEKKQREKEEDNR